MTSVTELVKLFNAGYSTVNVRIKRGETPEEIEIALQQSHVKNPGKHRYKGEYLTIKEICELTGVKKETLRYYTDRGIEAEEALATIEQNKEKQLYLVDGKSMPLHEIAKQEKCAPISLKKHLSKGRTMQEAVDSVRRHKKTVNLIAEAVVQ